MTTAIVVRRGKDFVPIFVAPQDIGEKEKLVKTALQMLEHMGAAGEIEITEFKEEDGVAVKV